MSEVKKETTIRVYNRSQGTFTHGDIVLRPHSFLDIPESVWAIWKELTGFGGVCPIVLANEAPVAPAAETAKLKAEVSEKDAEIEKLKAQLENLTKLAASAKKDAVKKDDKSLG